MRRRRLRVDPVDEFTVATVLIRSVLRGSLLKVIYFGVLFQQ